MAVGKKKLKQKLSKYPAKQGALCINFNVNALINKLKFSDSLLLLRDMWRHLLRGHDSTLLCKLIEIALVYFIHYTVIFRPNGVTVYNRFLLFYSD